MIGLVHREDSKGWIQEYQSTLNHKSDLNTVSIGFSKFSSPILSETLAVSYEMYKECERCGVETLHFLSNAYAITPWNLSKMSKNTVITVQDLFQFYNPSPIDKFWEYLHARNVKKADKIIAISEYTKRDLIERYGIDREKIDVIPVSIDKELYHFVNSRELELPEKYLLYVGSGFERKNLDFLIEVHAKLSEEFEDLHLVLTGPISKQKSGALKKKAEKLGSKNLVIFTDWIDQEDMPELYSRAEVYVQPSQREGQGIPPIEAMACGTPPVVSNRTALPETVGTKRLTAPLKVKKFSKKIKKLLEDQEFYQEMARYGMERSKHFSREKAIERHSKVYRKLMQEEDNEFS